MVYGCSGCSGGVRGRMVNTPRTRKYVYAPRKVYRPIYRKATIRYAQSASPYGWSNRYTARRAVVNRRPRLKRLRSSPFKTRKSSKKLIPYAAYPPMHGTPAASARLARAPLTPRKSSKERGRSLTRTEAMRARSKSLRAKSVGRAVAMEIEVEAAKAARASKSKANKAGKSVLKVKQMTPQKSVTASVLDAHPFMSSVDRNAMQE